MLMILIAILVSFTCAVMLLRIGDDGYSGWRFVAVIAGFIMLILTSIASFAFALAAYGWLAADAKADIINREYGTYYTQEEVFFASDVIDTIREIDRTRVEVNGDLMRDEQEK